GLDSGQPRHPDRHRGPALGARRSDRRGARPLRRAGHGIGPLPGGAGGRTVRSRALAAALAAGSAAGLATWGQRRRLSAGLDWERTNHAGQRVSLWEGAAYASGASIGALAFGSPAGAVAGLGSAAFGAVDDHRGDSGSKGLKGHLGALARGEVTTGAVKVLGIGAAGLASAVVVDRAGPGRRVSASTLIGGALIAGAANLGNLLDLRPGRTLKTTALLGLPLLPGTGGVSSAA